MRRLLAAQHLADIQRGGGDHRLDHEAGLRHAARHRRRPDRRNRDAHADPEYVRIFRILLVLVDDDETARIDEAVNAAQRRDPAERRQHHRIGERQFARRLDRAVVGDLFDRHLARLDLLHPRAGDPLDVVLAHFALEQALGVADAVEADVADVGFGGDEGHRHAVADAAAPQFGLEDEGELVSGAKA